MNKIGKNIRKSPLNQPNFNNNAVRQQPQPQVYNICKNDFRDIVQQLTGSPSHDPPPRPPLHNPPKPQSMRLQKIRPPPLTRPPQFQPPSSTPLQSLTPGPGDMIAESPISAYMRYLQSSIVDPGPRGNLAQPQPPSSALLPKPPFPVVFSPGQNGPTPPMNPSPQSYVPPLLPSPSSQFLLPSPTSYMNLLFPRSPYPLLSPGAQLSYPLTPNFPFSPMPQPGILGPGPQFTPLQAPYFHYLLQVFSPFQVLGGEINSLLVGILCYMLHWVCFLLTVLTKSLQELVFGLVM